MGKKSKRNNKHKSSGQLKGTQPSAAARPAPQPSESTSETTNLADAKYCVACGAADAPLLCPCSQVSFCNEDCSKKAWPVHRLICPAKAGKKRKKDSKLLSGDIVKIHGLVSESGKRWNGCLAEIQSYNKEKQRYIILFSTRTPYEIKAVLIKKENLELHLAVEEAAHAAYERDKRNLKTIRRSPLRERDAIKRMANPGRFVQKLENHELGAVMALGSFPNLLVNPNDEMLAQLCMDLLECGLAKALLQDYMFPVAIDAPAQDLFPEAEDLWLSGVMSLVCCLNHLHAIPHIDLSKIIEETVQMMGPFVLIMCSKKRRLCGSMNEWCTEQCCLVELLVVCCSAGKQTFIDSIYSMPEECWLSLMEHLVMFVCIDHTVFLQSASDSAEIAVGHNEISDSILNVMAVLVDPEHVAPSIIQKFGLIPVPFGAQNYVGCSFASVAPKVFARIFLNKEDIIGSLPDHNFITRAKRDELNMKASLELADQAAFVSCCFYQTHLLDTETRGADGYPEFTVKMDSWEEYVGRAKKLQ